MIFFANLAKKQLENKNQSYKKKAMPFDIASIMVAFCGMLLLVLHFAS